MIEIPEPTLRLLEVAGSWVSGVGALLAVWVSLSLARRQTAVRLSVRAGLRLIVTPGECHKPEYVSIEVVNVGQAPVVITNVGWRWGNWKKRYAVQLLDGIAPSQVPPVTLTTGQQALFLVPVKESNWIANMANGLGPSRWPWLTAWSLKVWISTSLGNTVTETLEKDLRQELVAAIRRLPRQG
jgi:hypothetical protein